MQLMFCRMDDYHVTEVGTQQELERTAQFNNFWFVRKGGSPSLVQSCSYICRTCLGKCEAALEVAGQAEIHPSLYETILEYLLVTLSGPNKKPVCT